MTPSQKALIAGCILGLLGAGGAILFARRQQDVQAYYGAEPQRLQVADLAANGLQGQHWVELTDFRLGKRAVVGAQRGANDAFWIPAFAAGAAERPPIHVVLRSSKSRSLEEFGLRLRDRTTFRGAILKPIAAASSSRELLAASYPDHVLAPQLWELDIDFGGPSISRWTTVVHSASAGFLLFAVICLLGFIGSSFARKENLLATGYPQDLVNISQ